LESSGVHTLLLTDSYAAVDAETTMSLSCCTYPSLYIVLVSYQEERLANLGQVPLTMPEPFVELNLRQFPSSRKRAMTGLEAAEEEEADRRRQ
jgi:hypothetical protein